MKSKRLQVFVLILVAVIVIAGAGVLYAADLGQVNRQSELTDSITRNQATLQNGIEQKRVKENELAELEAQLANSQFLIGSTEFLDSAESIEYDYILLSIADSTGLQVTNLTATEPLDIKEGDIIYKITTIDISLEGKMPEQVVHDTESSTNYINNTLNNILSYINKLASVEDFFTTDIVSVSISAPESMTEEDINDMLYL